MVRTCKYFSTNELSSYPHSIWQKFYLLKQQQEAFGPRDESMSGIPGAASTTMKTKEEKDSPKSVRDRDRDRSEREKDKHR